MIFTRVEPPLKALALEECTSALLEKSQDIRRPRSTGVTTFTSDDDLRAAVLKTQEYVRSQPIERWVVSLKK